MFLALLLCTLLTTHAAQDLSLGIKHAQELLLKKDRVSALEKVRELRRENLNNKAALLRIDREAEKLGTLFLTESGQKDYEMAESLLYSGSETATAFYKKAQSQESGNFLVISGQVRDRLAKKDCTAAEEGLTEGLELWPQWLEFKWLKLLVANCKGEPVENEDLAALADRPQFYVFARSLQLSRLIETGRTKEALTMAEAVAKKDAQYPETYYYLWKATEQDKAAELENAEKYLNICKTVTAKERRKYYFNPWLCGYASEAASAIQERKSSE